MNEQRFANTPGKRIRLLRTDLNMTQADLVEALEKAGVPVGQSYISEVERSAAYDELANGEKVYRLPGGNLLRGLAQVLHTTTDYIALMTDDPNLPARADEEALIIPLPDPTIRRELETLCNLYQQATTEHRAALMAFLRAFTVKA